MARTNRKDLPPAPASVDALDDLNLDDMFQGGDDSLFDGLDIDLDGMGEITGAADDEKSSSIISKDLDAMKQNLLGPEITAPASGSSTSKRRKTKRKTKTPPALEEEDDGDDAPTKKKKRTSKSGTTKKSKSKSKQKNSSPAPSEGSTSGKSKSKARTMPPPLPRSTSSGQGMVAAAGQFGGRTQKRGAYGVPVERPTTERQKSKTKLTAPQGITKAKSALSQSPKSARARGNGSKQQKTESPISTAMTPEQSNFCGLLPSATIFYPFLPALPAEPSMRKCNRLYPSIDKIHSAFTSQSNSRESTPNPLSYNMTTSTLKNEPLFQILEGGKDNSSAPAPTAAEMLRSAALTSSIAASRKTISQLGKSEVISDLQGICKLLSKQYEFLNQNCENMKRWCKDHFSEKDYSAVYGPLSTLAASSKKQRLLAESSSQRLSRQSGLATLGLLSGRIASVVKVKVKCGGFKEPKTGPLLAQLPFPPNAIQPQSAVARFARPANAPPAAVKIEPSKTSATKKRKIATKARTEETSLTTPGIITPKVEVVVSYGGSKPSQRRKSIADVVARRAHLLETKYVETKERRRQALARQEAGLQDIVNDDEIVVSNTSALWKWIEKSAYFEAFTEEDIDEMLHYAWQPEMTQRELFCEKVTPLQLKKREQDNKVSTESLFDRLQSLLVEEGSDDEMETDDDMLLDGWQTTKSEGKLPTILDMSELTLEERTYIQLRAIGLVDGQFLPSTKPALIEEDDSSSDVSVDENGDAALSSQENGTSSNVEDDSLKDMIRAMQDDLSRLHRLTNSRTALLQSAAKAHLSVTEQSKRKEEDNIMQISRYNQLLKKQKENKRSARQKSFKKDEDWVPW